jgi:hypothetical protein
MLGLATTGMRIDTFAPTIAGLQDGQLTVQHFARLRHFARYTWDPQELGWPLRGLIDEELASLGLLQPGGKERGWFISKLGKEVFEFRAAFEAGRRKPHHALAARASRWLERQGRAAWLNRNFELHLKPDQRVLEILGLGHEDFASIISQGANRKTVARPDVISIVPSETRSDWNCWILEAKVSRRDFVLDVRNPRKRYAYALLARQVFYLTPAGLISEDELPTGCGLIVESRPGFFAIVRNAGDCKPVRSAHINRLLRGH